MNTIYLVLYVVAAVCFALAAWKVTERVSLIALGLLAWVLVPLIVTLRAH